MLKKNIIIAVLLVVGMATGMFLLVDHIATIAAERAVVMMLGPKSNGSKPDKKQFEDDWEKDREMGGSEDKDPPSTEDEELFKE